MAAPDTASFWDDIYRNDMAGWDMKTPTPVFENLLDAKKFIKPGKILIAGCGKGYDAVLAAKNGYDVYADDFSIEAIKFARDLAEKEKVKVNFLLEDIFRLDSIYKDYFDYIYDYVTYCAVIPERRKEYVEKIAGLLKPGGKLIALLFPVEDRKGGPPFAVDVQEFYDLVSRHLSLIFSSKKINSIKPRNGREVLQIYLKKEVENINADQP
jgi:SAM-dependent methyltransferase